MDNTLYSPILDAEVNSEDSLVKIKLKVGKY